MTENMDIDTHREQTALKTQGEDSHAHKPKREVRNRSFFHGPQKKAILATL